jgi:hypothetical protein
MSVAPVPLRDRRAEGIMELLFAVLGFAIAGNVAADLVHNQAVLWLGLAMSWLGVVWIAIARA